MPSLLFGNSREERKFAIAATAGVFVAAYDNLGLMTMTDYIRNLHLMIIVMKKILSI
jgi:hypothetical protein